MNGLLSVPPFRLRDSERSVFRGRPRFSTLDWALREMRVVLGPYRGQRWTPEVTPYAPGIFEVYDMESVRKIFLIASSQVAKTTMALICLFADQCRRQENMGMGYPDQLAARKVMNGIIHKYYENIAPLRAMLPNDDAMQNFEVAHRDGSRLYAMWAGSDSSARSISMARILIDEEDAASDKSAVLTMQERVTAYQSMGLSKIIRCCRPKGTEEESTIWSDAKREAQAWMRYQVRCPVCGTMQVMDDEHIVSIDPEASAKSVGSRRLARYQCAGCGGLWNDMQRDLALRNGNWTVEEGTLHGATAVAFHLRLWESTLVSLSSVLAEKMTARDNPRLLQIYENNVRARPYRFASSESTEEQLAAYIDHNLTQGIVPDWAVALTLSADMQQDHFWFSVAAHGVDPDRMHILDYGRVAEWADLTNLVFQSRYRTADGREFGIWRAALDTGGGKKSGNEDTRPMQAQKWLGIQRPGVVYGTKGMSRESPGVFVRISQPDRAGAKTRTAAMRTTPLYLLDTHNFKKLIFWCLSPEGEESEPLSFHAQTDAGYLHQIASERLVQDKNGSERWEKIHRDNHLLDCLVGHKAMAHWQWQPSLARLAGRPAALSGNDRPEKNPFTGGNRLLETL